MALIFTCWAVYFAGLLGGEELSNYMVRYWGVVPYAIIMSTPISVFRELLSLFTHMFIHGSFSHVANNTAWLLLLGFLLEPVLGLRRFLAVYFLSGLAGVLGFIVFAPTELALSPLVGASGAVAGLLGVFVMRSWQYRGDPLSVLRVIALLWIAAWIYRQVAGLAGYGDQHVGYITHVAGALFGGLWYWWTFMRFHADK
jgi:membrane associated rhomboid family serine protease